jgi:calpain-15
MEDKHQTLWAGKEWKRAGEICPNFRLFGKNVGPNDIQQSGCLGNCYFVASVASFAERPNRVRAMFHNKVKNSAGCYLIKFYVNGVPTGIMVDDLFLCGETNGGEKYPVFARFRKNKIWVPLIEKAWAKYLGSYTRSDGYFSGVYVSMAYALHTFTGAPTKTLFTDVKAKHNNYWEMLKIADKQDYMMTVATKKDYDVASLVANHAYSLIAVNELEH